MTAQKDDQQHGLSQSLEDYLEAIFVIADRRGEARTKEIADRLGVTNASVSGALRALRDRGLVHHEPYDGVTLTEEGRRLAQQVDRKHKALHGFFCDVLGVAEPQAAEIACRVEHAIPDLVRTRLVRLRDVIAEKGVLRWDDAAQDFVIGPE
jgi:DtxR family Mn-dependent transcriptional regulator